MYSGAAGGGGSSKMPEVLLRNLVCHPCATKVCAVSRGWLTSGLMDKEPGSNFELRGRMVKRTTGDADNPRASGHRPGDSLHLCYWS